MVARDYQILLFGWCLAVACAGKSSSGDRKKDAGGGSGGSLSTGGAPTGGSSKGGSAGKGGRGGAGGSIATGGASGSGATAGEPDAGQAGEGMGGTGGEPSDCAQTVVITSEADLVAFAALGCEVLDGSLIISSPTLRYLDALGQPSRLRAITGDLVLDDNPVLENLEGFYGLESIGGSLVVTSNFLENFYGLDSVRTIGSDAFVNNFILTDNWRLTNANGLGGLTRLRTSLVVSNNAELTILSGIDRVLTANGITIVNNPRLSEIGGLTDLESAVTFTVAGNPSLVTLSLPNFADVNSFTLTTNASLESADLSALATADTLTIADNQALETVGTLNALVDVGTLVIAGNAKLPQCFVDALDLRLRACMNTCGGNDTTAVCN